MSEGERYQHLVERCEEGPGHMRIALVRQRQREDGRFLHHHEITDRTVLFAKRFRPMLELAALEHYAEQLSLVARHADEGTFGCFVETYTEDGDVAVCLYERWFDGDQIHTDELARRAFDASDGTALVASAEFLADLRDWAERRNRGREAAYLEELEEDDARSRIAADREAASAELNEILAAHTHDT